MFPVLQYIHLINLYIFQVFIPPGSESGSMRHIIMRVCLDPDLKHCPGPWRLMVPVYVEMKNIFTWWCDSSRLHVSQGSSCPAFVLTSSSWLAEGHSPLHWRKQTPLPEYNFNINFCCVIDKGGSFFQNAKNVYGSCKILLGWQKIKSYKSGSNNEKNETIKKYF